MRMTSGTPNRRATAPAIQESSEEWVLSTVGLIAVMMRNSSSQDLRLNLPKEEMA